MLAIEAGAAILLAFVVGGMVGRAVANAASAHLWARVLGTLPPGDALDLLAKLQEESQR